MPSKKEKHQQVLTSVKSQTMPLGNSTNTTPPPASSIHQRLPLGNSYHSVTTNHLTKKINDQTNSFDHLSLIRDQKHDLDQLNNRFSNYVDALRKRSKENHDLQKKVENEKNKFKNVSNQDHHDLESKMDELRNDVDESAVLTEHFVLKRNRALKELALLKDKIRTEEDPSYSNRRQALEAEYQQSLLQLQDLIRRYEELENHSQTNRTELEQMNDLYKKLEDQLHDLILNNMRLECNLRTIEEKSLLTKAIYETEKAELANEQIKQQQFYTNELDKAIEEIKHDFQILLQNNKVILENAYTERIEQVKSQILTHEANKQQESLITSRISSETLHEDLKQTEKERDDLENEYRPLIDRYLTKQKEKNQIDEERIRLDNEYTRLINEISHLTEAIEIGKQYWFSVHFELETYRRLLDLETTKSTIVNHHSPLSNGKPESGINELAFQQPIITTIKKIESQQRAITKTGKFDIDQVQAGFISINNAATNCVDQPLKGWTLVRTLNDEKGSTFQFPDTYVLKARTRVRVYSNKAENSSVQGRLVASAIPAWASTNQGDNVKILLLDDKGMERAQYSETWQ